MFQRQSFAGRLHGCVCAGEIGLIRRKACIMVPAERNFSNPARTPFALRVCIDTA
jgi:hypothetical protein